jgi:hypothetical protein
MVVMVGVGTVELTVARVEMVARAATLARVAPAETGAT